MVGPSDSPELNEQCCFCGKGISTSGEGVRITIEIAADGAQELYAHRACLRRAVSASVPLLFE